jgi:hypothetical protein
MIAGTNNPRPRPESEFLGLIEKIDAALISKETPISCRVIPALGLIREFLKVDIPITTKKRSPTPGSYEGEDLTLRVVNWYEQLYGDRMLHDFRPGRTVLLLRGDIWTFHFPRFYGRAQVFCSQTESTLRPPNGRGPVRYNVLDAIEDLAPGLRNALCKSELGYIEQVFELGHKSLQELESIHHIDLATDAFADLNAAVFHLTVRNRHHGLSKWASLQAAEKILKAFLKEKTGGFKNGHTLEPLALAAERAGLPPINRRLLKTVQCTANVRYGEEPVSLIEAVDAHHASLSICCQAAQQLNMEELIPE